MKTTSILQIILCYGAALCTTSPEPSPQTTTVTKRIHIIPTMLAAPTKQSAGTTTKLCTKTIPHKKVINRNEYAVAATLPLHGEIAITGKQVQFGTNLYFDKLKREVSTHSLPLFTYFFLDNNTDAQRARTDLQELRKQSPALLNLFGTKMIVALEKQMHNGNWASFFPLEGLDELRSQTAGNSIYLRASYHEELQALINYAVNTLNYRKIALFYEASDFGDGILTQFKKVLNDYGLVPAALGAYPENTVNISQAITSIINGAPNAIICASGARPTYNFISQMINHGMHRCAFLGLSPLFAVQKTLQKSRGINIIVSSVVPDPFKSSIPIVKEYQAAMKKYLSNKTISPVSFEAYINAALFAHAVAQTPAPVTARSVMATLESYRNLNFKGIHLAFDPLTRGLSHTVWLNNGENKEWVMAQQSNQ